MQITTFQNRIYDFDSRAAHIFWQYNSSRLVGDAALRTLLRGFALQLFFLSRLVRFITFPHQFPASMMLR